MEGLLDFFKQFFNKEPPPKRDTDYIPPGAELYGPGPDYIADTIANQRPAMGVATHVGDPFAPTMGKTQPTHQSVIEDGLYGDPRQHPSRTEAYWDRLDTDDSQRHSAQQRDTNGWETPVRDRLSYVPVLRPETNRWTGSAHPELDSTVVPSATGMQPYNLNGMHMSLADHRRDYEIYGMTPMKSSRNTYRVEPTAWDLDIIDSPAGDQIPVQAEVEVPATVASSYMGNRNYRLGG